MFWHVKPSCWACVQWRYVVSHSVGIGIPLSLIQCDRHSSMLQCFCTRACNSTILSWHFFLRPRDGTQIVRLPPDRFGMSIVFMSPPQ